MLGALPRELMQHIHCFMEFEDSTMTVQLLRMLHVLTRKSTLCDRCIVLRSHSSGSGIRCDGWVEQQEKD